MVQHQRPCGCFERDPSNQKRKLVAPSASRPRGCDASRLTPSPLEAIRTTIRTMPEGTALSALAVEKLQDRCWWRKRGIVVAMPQCLRHSRLSQIQMSRCQSVALIPDSLLVSISRCVRQLQRSRGLGSFFQIELSNTARTYGESPEI